MFLGMDIYSWIAAIVIALIVTFLPNTLPFKIVLAMVEVKEKRGWECIVCKKA